MNDKEKLDKYDDYLKREGTVLTREAGLWLIAKVREFQKDCPHNRTTLGSKDPGNGDYSSIETCDDCGKVIE